jgi:hypothetical protein
MGARIERPLERVQWIGMAKQIQWQEPNIDVARRAFPQRQDSADCLSPGCSEVSEAFRRVREAASK